MSNLIHYNLVLDKNKFLVLNLRCCHNPILLVERMNTKIKFEILKLTPRKFPLRDVNIIHRLTTLILALMARFVYLTLVIEINNNIEE